MATHPLTRRKALSRAKKLPKSRPGSSLAIPMPPTVAAVGLQGIAAICHAKAEA